MEFFPNPRKVHTTPGEILEITFYYHEQLKLLEGRIVVEKALVKNPAVTIAQMIKLEEPFFLSDDFLETFRPKNAEESSAIMILDTSTKIIRIIPTKSSTVIKLYFEYSIRSHPQLLQELGDVFTRNKVKTIYSTGVCLAHEPPCRPYVGYIDSTDFSISEDQLKSELLALPNVRNVELTQCSL